MPELELSADRDAAAGSGSRRGETPTGVAESSPTLLSGGAR
jgi:hypothetical protein